MKEAPDQKVYALTDIEEYETLVAAIPGGIVVVVPDSTVTILFASQGFYDLVGFEQAEYDVLYLHSGTEALHPDDRVKTIEDAVKQLRKDKKFCVKARLRHKQKGYIWVQFSGRFRQAHDGSTKVYVVIVDISEQLAALESLEQEKTFNELIASLSEEACFDCDLTTGVTRYSKNFSQKLGFPETVIPDAAMFSTLGLPMPHRLWEEKQRLFRAHENILEDELHVQLPNGADVWYQYRCSPVMNQEGVPVRLVGKFVDITQHKLQIGALSELAQKDQLTKLYNKTATEERIKETLKMRRLHDDIYALLIIDIDNFKNVNDRLGHLYGDAVLAQLAEYLKHLFRAEDVVGRVGGDEFFVFLKNCRSVEMLRAKAENICALFHRTYSEGDAFVTISASVGIALCPEHGIQFDTLYQHADIALYHAKAQGKNTFSIFSNGFTQSYVSERTEIDSNLMQKNFNENRIEYVFRLLYDSGNPASSIQAVLQLIAESYGFSRGYIFEFSTDGQYTSNTFEWCTKEISAEIQSLQNLPVASISTATEAFRNQGMFLLKSVRALPEVERDILEPQGILSMFQFAIRDMGKLVGFIGFDDCTKERIPTDAEIDEICTVCHVLATFVLKHRSNEREVCHYKAIETVIDHMSGYSYVIDPNQYTILYENQNVVRLTGHASIGQKCHLAYRGNPVPCRDCLMAHLSESAPKYTEEIFNEKFDIFVNAEASLIDWFDTRKACLICGVDITEYKLAESSRNTGESE